MEISVAPTKAPRKRSGKRPGPHKTRRATIRFTVGELDAIENLGAQIGSNRHRLIRLAVEDSVRSGRMAELARVATAIISPSG
jgi:hypothetical protein